MAVSDSWHWYHNPDAPHCLVVIWETYGSGLGGGVREHACKLLPDHKEQHTCACDPPLTMRLDDYVVVREQRGTVLVSRMERRAA